MQSHSELLGVGTSTSELWKLKVAQSCPTLCNPRDYTVHGILQARILEWVAFPFSRGSSQPKDWCQVSWIGGGFFTKWAIREAFFELWGNTIQPITRLNFTGIRLGYDFEDFKDINKSFFLITENIKLNKIQMTIEWQTMESGIGCKLLNFCPNVWIPSTLQILGRF